MSSFFFLFMLMYLMSFMMVLGVDDWFLIWLGMEINMMSFLFMIYNRSSLVNIESCFKYFFIQGLSSAFFMSLFYMNKENLMYLGSVVLSYKIGGGPFYFWFPSVCSGITWVSCFFLMTIQKVIPLVLMMMFISWMVWLIGCVSLLFGAVGSFNQVNVKRLMGFSSIHHVGWMLMCMMVDEKLCFIYLLLYVMMNIPVMYLFLSVDMNDVGKVKKMGKMDKWVFVLLMLNIGGVPPMFGFILSWIGFYFIVKLSTFFVFLMIVTSVMMFYVYMRISYDVLLGMEMDISWKMMDIFKLFKIEGNSLILMIMIFGGLFIFL